MLRSPDRSANLRPRAVVARPRASTSRSMIQNCLQYAQAAKAAGRPVVGILCEFTPRELIMAAGGVPVCLCGGSAKTIPAAEEHLPANLCPLIKSTFGYHVLRNNPFLEMADLVVARDDLRRQEEDVRADGRDAADVRPRTAAESRRPRRPGALAARAAASSAAFSNNGSRRKSPTDALRQAIAMMNRERALRRELAALMAADSPPLTGRHCWTSRAASRASPRIFGSTSGPGCVSRPCAATAEPIARNRNTTIIGTSPVSDRGPRPDDRRADGARRRTRAGNDRRAGGLVVAAENCTGLKPILEDVDETAADPLRALAEKYFHLPCSVMTRNDRRLESLRQLAAEYRPECVVELIWQACLTYDVEVAPRPAAGGGGTRPAVPADRDRLFAVRFRADCRAGGGPVRDHSRRATASRRNLESREDGHGRLLQPVCPRRVVGCARPAATLAAAAAQLPAREIGSDQGERTTLRGFDLPVNGRRGVCPLAAAVADAVSSAAADSAVVLTTCCDQMRYAASLLEDQHGVPVFVMNVPSTWQTEASRSLYLAELQRLSRFLVARGGTPPSNEELAGVMLRFDQARAELRKSAAACRLASSPPRCWRSGRMRIRGSAAKGSDVQNSILPARIPHG